MVATTLDTGFKIVATTDVPCHLFCRITDHPPLKHALPTYRRGIYLQGDIRFCFVVYHDNEQDEPGDTTTHTFYKLDWPFCQTRWFYFIGNILGIGSPSESAIFSLHFTTPPFSPIIIEPWTYYGPPPPTFYLKKFEPWSTY